MRLHRQKAIDVGNSERGVADSGGDSDDNDSDNGGCGGRGYSGSSGDFGGGSGGGGGRGGNSIVSDGVGANVGANAAANLDKFATANTTDALNVEHFDSINESLLFGNILHLAGNSDLFPV